MNRPDLKVGDVVRLSHKGLQNGGSYRSRLAKKAFTVIATPMHATNQDGRDRIRVAVTDHTRITRMTFLRKELWYTGYNVADEGKTIPQFTKQPKTAGKQPVGSAAFKPMPLTPSMANALNAIIKGSAPPKKVIPDPQKKHEVPCRGCGRMADFGHKCWWCETQN